MPLAAHLVAELDILPVTQNMGSECLRTGFWMTISPSWHYPSPNSPPKGPARLPGDPDGWCPAPRVAAWNLGPHLSTCLLSAAPCLPPHPAQYGYSPATVLDKGAESMGEGSILGMLFENMAPNSLILLLSRGGISILYWNLSLATI